MLARREPIVMIPKGGVAIIRFLSWLSAIFWTGLGILFLLLRIERIAEACRLHVPMD